MNQTISEIYENNKLFENVLNKDKLLENSLMLDNHLFIKFEKIFFKDNLNIFIPILDNIQIINNHKINKNYFITIQIPMSLCYIKDNIINLFVAYGLLYDNIVFY